MREETLHLKHNVIRNEDNVMNNCAICNRVPYVIIIVMFARIEGGSCVGNPGEHGERVGWNLERIYCCLPDKTLKLVRATTSGDFALCIKVRKAVGTGFSCNCKAC